MRRGKRVDEGGEVRRGKWVDRGGEMGDRWMEGVK